ncbi:MAG: restriction endonuclease subunit S [Anaerolineae bacterium]
MSWQQARLADISSMRTGKLDSNAAIPEGAYPFFTCAQETLRIDEPAFDTEAVLLGGNNAAGIFPLKYYNGQFNAYQRTYVIESLAPDVLNIRYLYYALRPALAHFQSASIGAATQYLTKGILDNFQVPLPPVTIQNRIVIILSAYDDLIENNRRRIRLLEEAARLLYREWFVHLRFPGHEHVAVVDGVPEGWERKRLIEVADIRMGQSPKSIYYNQDGNGLPFHQGVSNFGGRFPSHEVFCTILSRLAEPGDILFSVRAPVGRINITRDKIVIGRGLAAIRSNCDQQNFLFYALKSHFFKDDMMGTGAIFAAITKNDLHGVQLMHPPLRLIEMFTEHAQPIDRQIENLQQTIDGLVKARDLLLPRLMNGEISV